MSSQTVNGLVELQAARAISAAFTSSKVAALSAPSTPTHHTTTAPAYFYNAAFAAKWNKYTGSGSWSVIG